MREIITLQLGELSNYAGAHFWNLQVGLAPIRRAAGPPAAHRVRSGRRSSCIARAARAPTPAPAAAPLVSHPQDEALGLASQGAGHDGVAEDVLFAWSEDAHVSSARAGGAAQSRPLQRTDRSGRTRAQPALLSAHRPELAHA